MKTDDLTDRALDYWCARALVGDDEEIRFVAIEPELVVTLEHGELRLLDRRFAPSSDWADAGIVLELARELTLTTRDDGSALCRARFADCEETGEAAGATLRTALLRAFVQAHCGSEVDDRLPDAPMRCAAAPLCRSTPAGRRPPTPKTAHARATRPAISARYRAPDRRSAPLRARLHGPHSSQQLSSIATGSSSERPGPLAYDEATAH
jgi:hypothetical protein